MPDLVASIRIPLSLIPTRLGAFDGVRPSYPAVYKAALNAKIPATWDNGRWYVEPCDLLHVAEAFGMRAKAPEAVSDGTQ